MLVKISHGQQAILSFVIPTRTIDQSCDDIDAGLTSKNVHKD